MALLLISASVRVIDSGAGNCRGADQQLLPKNFACWRPWFWEIAWQAGQDKPTRRTDTAALIARATSCANIFSHAIHETPPYTMA